MSPFSSHDLLHTLDIVIKHTSDNKPLVIVEQDKCRQMGTKIQEANIHLRSASQRRNPW